MSDPILARLDEPLTMKSPHGVTREMSVNALRAVLDWAEVRLVPSTANELRAVVREHLGGW